MSSGWALRYYVHCSSFLHLKVDSLAVRSQAARDSGEQKPEDGGFQGQPRLQRDILLQSLPKSNWWHASIPGFWEAEVRGSVELRS